MIGLTVYVLFSIHWEIGWWHLWSVGQIHFLDNIGLLLVILIKFTASFNCKTVRTGLWQFCTDILFNTLIQSPWCYSQHCLVCICGFGGTYYSQFLNWQGRLGNDCADVTHHVDGLHEAAWCQSDREQYSDTMPCLIYFVSPISREWQFFLFHWLLL